MVIFHKLRFNKKKYPQHFTFCTSNLKVLLWVSMWCCAAPFNVCRKLKQHISFSLELFRKMNECDSFDAQRRLGAKYWEYCACKGAPRQPVHRDKNLALNFYLSQTNQRSPCPSTCASTLSCKNTCTNCILCSRQITAPLVKVLAQVL